MAVIIRPGATNTSKASVLWDSVLSKATIVSETRSDPLRPVINAVKDPSTWSSWSKSVAGQNAFAVFDCLTPVTVDSLGISAHNLWSTNNDILIQRSDDGVTFTNVFSYVPTSDDDFLILFPTVTARYFRIYMRQLAVDPKICSISVMFLGRRLVFPHAPVDSYTPLHHSRTYEKLYNDSLKGHFLSNRVMSAGAETTVDMGFLDRNWLESNIRGFEKHYNQGGTFFYSSAPSRYPDDMGYCRSANSDESLAIEFIEGDKLSSLSFGVRSYVGS